MKLPDAANVGLGTEKIVPDPNLKALPSLPNALALPEVVTDRPGSQLVRTPARPKPRPYWVTVWGLWHGCKWLALVFSSFKSTFEPWTSSIWPHRETSGIIPLSIKFALRSIEPSTTHCGQSWKSAESITVSMRMFLRIRPRPAFIGPLKSQTSKVASSTWQSRLSHTMHSISRANTCKLLEPPKQRARKCLAYPGRIACPERLYVIKSVSFGSAS
jgi:hypothetical protein